MLLLKDIGALLQLSALCGPNAYIFLAGQSRIQFLLFVLSKSPSSIVWKLTKITKNTRSWSPLIKSVHSHDEFTNKLKRQEVAG